LNKFSVYMYQTVVNTPSPYDSIATFDYLPIDNPRPGITFPTIPQKKQPQVFTPDSPLPAAAAAEKPRTSSAITWWKNKALEVSQLGLRVMVWCKVCSMSMEGGKELVLQKGGDVARCGYGGRIMYYD